MTIRLYLTPLPETTSETASGQIGSDIQQAGLLDTGGTAVENIATENVDFRKQGRIQFGPALSRKVAEELDSLSESSYTTLPLYSSDGSLARKRGYYEVARADVEPAQEARDDVYQYDVNLTLAGTREDSRRAVRTNPQDVPTSLASGDPAPIFIPDAATGVRWYDDAEGTATATPGDTFVSAEFGDVTAYHPEDAPFDKPTLVYDLDFADDGPLDVRLYDDRGRDKFAPTASGGEVNTWIHAYHTGYQFDGRPVVDSNRLRVYYDTDAGAVTAEERALTTEGYKWVDVGLTMDEYELADVSFERIAPTGVRARVTLKNTDTGETADTIVTQRRGRDEVLLQPVPGETLDTGADVVFDEIASTQTTDPQPGQGLIDRSKL